MKKKRHQRLMTIIAEEDIQTQEQLTEALRGEGFAVTQATVSRDIKELGLVKTPSASGGYKYALSQKIAKAPENKEHMTIFSNSVIGVDSALHTVVIHTYEGMANAVAASLDKINTPEVLGSIAGDDTILLVTRSEAAAAETTKRLSKLFAREGI